MTERIYVVVGVIFNKDNDSVLIARRTQNRHLAGYWEFPGGKIHAGEKPSQALQRELSEELGIVINNATPYMQIKHDYQGKKVLLDVYKVVSWKGEVRAIENQEIKWVPLDQLRHYLFPEANQRIILNLMLPELCLISRAHYARPSELINILEACKQQGLCMFQLRLPGCNAAELAGLVATIKEFNADGQLLLILNGSPEDIYKYDINGIHLKSDQMFEYTTRPIANDRLLGASCHSPAEFEQAHRLDVDYIFLSPVKATRTHPYVQPIGWPRFMELCCLSEKPVYALGGMDGQDLGIAKQHGAAGVAMIEAVWSAAKPERVIASMLNA